MGRCASPNPSRRNFGRASKSNPSLAEATPGGGLACARGFDATCMAAGAMIRMALMLPPWLHSRVRSHCCLKSFRGCSSAKGMDRRGGRAHRLDDPRKGRPAPLLGGFLLHAKSGAPGHSLLRAHRSTAGVVLSTGTGLNWSLSTDLRGLGRSLDDKDENRRCGDCPSLQRCYHGGRWRPLKGYPAGDLLGWVKRTDCGRRNLPQCAP